MNKIFLDTSAYSHFKRGHPKVLDAIKHADKLYMNSVVIGELLAGFDGGRFKQQNRGELREFLERDPVCVHPVTEETAERYSLIYNLLKKRGTPIPTNDMWIAASVLETGCFLMTTDTDFAKLELIPSLILEIS